VETDDFLKEGTERTLHINRMMTHGVIEAPFGAHFTHCIPDYQRDEAFQREYAETAKSPELWQAFVEKYIAIGGESEYRKVLNLGAK
jgi:glutaconate CoA-transferase subunit A